MRIRRAVMVLLCLTIVCAATAQMAERNVNVVSGTALPGGDPFLQRQNEPSIAVSTRNPMHLLAGANDYRTVDLPFVENDDEQGTGDAWAGWFKSTDGGKSWFTGLLPGYPQDPNKTPPLYGFQAAADPIVRPGFNGMLYYSGIAHDRTPTRKSLVFVARFNDFNNVEKGDPIKLLGISVVFDGRPQNLFPDKPAMAVDFPRSGQSVTCSVEGQTILGGNMYVVYTIVNAAETEATLWFSRSTDCGAAWSTPEEISGRNTLNQGAVIAIDPRTGDVYVVWRRIQSPTDARQTHAIMAARSTDAGRRFGKPVVISEIDPFDQGTTTRSFRTRAYPTVTSDATGRIYAAWADRKGPSGDARIMLSTSNDGSGWSTPVMVAPSSLRGHQIMPAISYSSASLMLVYYDLRETFTIGRLRREPPPYGDYLETRRQVADLPAQPQNVFNRFIVDAILDANNNFIGTPGRRHTLDVRASQGLPGALPVFASSVRVSQYQYGSIIDGPLVEIDPATGQPAIDQRQFNPPNLPMFKQGSVPFFGDYIDLAPQYPFLGSIFNNLPIPPPAFHAVWTDNRDVRKPADGNWANYTPVGVSGGASNYDPTKTAPDCEAGQTGMRNQNIYTSRITAGLFVGSPGNSKQTGSIQRAFVVLVQNTKAVTQSYRLEIANQPFGGKASFLQFPLDAPALTTVDITVNPKSTGSRSVFVTSTFKRSPVAVVVREISSPGGSPTDGGLTSATVLNGDISNPEIGNTGGSSDIANTEVYNPEIGNPEIGNPEIGNPEIGNPEIGNPEIGNLDVGSPEIGNPEIGNPEIGNPEIGNPEIGNPEIGNPEIGNGSMSDTTWELSGGNTTASYSVKLLQTAPIPPEYKLQLLLHYPYRTPAADGCTLRTRRHDILIGNYPSPTLTQLTDANIANPEIGNPAIPTAWIPAEGSINLTMRVVDPLRKGVTIDASKFVAPIAIAHAINTADLGKPNPEPPATLVITTASLPDGVTGNPYSATLNAFGGVPPYTWNTVTPVILSLVTSNLPPGMTLDTETGALGGAPSAPGTYSFTISATDSATPTPTVARRSYTINIQPSLNVEWLVQPTTTPAGEAINPAPRVRVLDNAGAPVPAALVSLTLGNNPGDVAFEPQSATTLEDGTATFPNVSINTPGSGYTLIVSASQVGFHPGSAPSAAFDVTVPLVITTTSLPDGVTGIPYDAPAMTSTGGTAPIIWEFDGEFDGTPPAGISLSPDGTFSGTPSQPGTYQFGIMATDSAPGAAQQTARRSFSIRVGDPTFTVTGRLLYNGQPTTPTTTPMFFVRNETTGQSQPGVTVTYEGGSTFEISGLPAGTFGVRFDSQEDATGLYSPGAFYAFEVFDAVAASDGGFDVDLLRVIHLTAPFDNAIWTEALTCPPGRTTPTATEFIWDPVEGATRYTVTLSIYRCTPFGFVRHIQSTFTDDNSITLGEPLAANQPDEFYLFTVHADAGERPVGILMDRSQNGSHGWDLRFRVVP